MPLQENMSVAAIPIIHKLVGQKSEMTVVFGKLDLLSVFQHNLIPVGIRNIKKLFNRPNLQARYSPLL
ncbi:MAG: hypothetical protein ACFB2X_20280 [Rivularia sp. (in: cyanobacteria)]